MTDIAGDSSTTVSIAIGGTINDSLEVVGDHDWIRLDLTAGQSISISLSGAGTSPLADSYLILRDAAGNQVAFDDDGGPVGYDSLLNFVATSSGTYYIDVGAYNNQYAGTYQLSVTERPPLPIYTNDQIADQLINGYWEANGGTARHFDVAPGGTLSVNLTALTAEGQFLARAALSVWTDIIGVTFNEVTSGGAIVFDDNDINSAYSSSSTSGGFITSSIVNVGTGWIGSYGTGLNTYSMQTYIHEIGHALGLGHAGNYNGSASYSTDALYQNDAWSTTVMSYFSQSDNDYFSNLGFTYNFVLTPMVADVLAMAQMYGLSTTTRTGNTVYGFNSTAGRDIFSASVIPNGAYTIIDSGGIDTLDYSGYSNNQRIDLFAEHFSNIGSGIGNVSIARGTVIENAIGGAGDDMMIGNSAANNLRGGDGVDTLRGNNGNDVLDGGIGGDRLYGGNGNDVIRDLSGNNRMFGEANDDRLYAGGGADYLDGGTGNDSLFAGGGNDEIHGGDGNDYVFAGEGDDTIYGGNDLDTIRAYNGNDTVYGDAGDDRLYGGNNDDHLEGGIGADSIFGEADNDVLFGGDGNDYMDGGSGTDQLSGDAGSDRLRGGAGSDHLDGGIGADTLYGGDLNDTLLGGADNDILFGEAGIDTLDGGAGNDLVSGGGGSDRLTGGTGADTFRFDTAFSGADTITDFSVADDTMSLNRTYFAGIGPAGALSASAFHLGTAAADADDHIIYDQATGRIYYDADGVGGAAQILFATVTAGTALTSADFLLYGG